MPVFGKEASAIVHEEKKVKKKRSVRFLLKEKAAGRVKTGLFLNPKRQGLLEEVERNK